MLLGNPNHLRRWLFTLLSDPSMAESGNSYTSSGHSILGRMLCWYIQALNFPGTPDLLVAISHPSRSWFDALMEAASFRVQLKIFPRLFTGFSWTDGIWVPPRVKLVCHLPSFQNQRPLFFWLEAIQTHVILQVLEDPSVSWDWCSRDCQIVRKSSDMGLVATELLVTDFVHPVLIPFSSRCWCYCARSESHINGNNSWWGSFF